MCASHVRRAAVCAAEAPTPRGNPKRERALFPTTRTCAFLKRCPWERRIFFRIQRPPARAPLHHHQQAVVLTKKKRAFGASRPDDCSSRNPSSSQTYPIARRRRRSLARPSLDRPHAFALAREPFSDPTLPAKPAGFAFSSREEKARVAAPLERRRPLPPRVARAQLCRLPPPRIARVVLVSSYRALRRDASDAREQTTRVSRRRRARRRPLVRRSFVPLFLSRGWGTRRRRRSWR